MLEELLPFESNSGAFVIASLLIAAVGAVLLYIILFYVLRSLFRQFEKDIALVTLDTSAYPALAIFVLLALKISFSHLDSIEIIASLENLLTASLIIVFSYWLIQLLNKVVIYYLRDYTQQTEVMWDDVLLPIIEAAAPIVILIVGGGLVLKSFGVDLTGIWVTLGGATFIIGFAIKDILANFFSGIVLLIDTPFQFGDVLCLEDGSLGMLKKIGVRVTQLYMFDSHCDIYIPNSKLQGQNITNLSRPTSYYYYETSIEIPVTWDLDRAKTIMEEIILAHPDTLGDIDLKLRFIEEFYQNELAGVSVEQQSIGKLRLLTEQEVNSKLEEIGAFLESLILTIQFAEKGGLNEEEIANIQQEYLNILLLIGFKVVVDFEENSSGTTLKETKSEDCLIELVREWYRASLKDPNLLYDDQYLISEQWERNINLLTKRVNKLWQVISNPEREETRVDDRVLELLQWLKGRFKQIRSQWQQPQVKMKGLSHDEDCVFVEFELNFYVDDIRLEDGKRGTRICSQIYQEIIRYFKNNYPSWSGNEEPPFREEVITEIQNDQEPLREEVLVAVQDEKSPLAEKTFVETQNNEEQLLTKEILAENQNDEESRSTGEALAATTNIETTNIVSTNSEQGVKSRLKAWFMGNRE
ncbi:small-conductance mechanosensitive channel [Xenococcus sp. PCC 7305]|uniref:mechanosensitive ion channel family protein n=1 Tax=Xenococcus sp. PCC 7305 TaxID=102125 RepID=UPI0002ABBFB8|nr:mechanosensitive ion channel family protein [Xenococcus sp. PCC 7305]ELS01560.1 small-conductance mechanosensitive channel [Xenococcus sp. PCC 7305]